MTVPPGQTLIEFDRVSKRFGPVAALETVSFRIVPGEFFTLLGPSGCGKTTTLRLLAGLEEPDAGTVRLAGQVLNGVPPYRRNLGLVFQHYALFPHLSVERNVAYGLERRRVPRGLIAERVREALRLVKLDPAEYGRRRPVQLSGGQRQRVALARALVTGPPVLLLDEPLGALDLSLRKAMQLELRELNRSLGTTFVYVTHDQAEALSLSDRIAVMDRGRIEQVGSPREVYERPATAFVAGFIGESNLLQDVAGRRAVVRPERIALEPAGSGAAPTGLPGTVEEVVYLGERFAVLVGLATGERVMASIPNEGIAASFPFARGAAVVVSWRPEDAWVL